MRIPIPTLAIATSLAVIAPAVEAEQHATARLIVETSAAVPGQTLHLGISFQIERDWHLYWNGRNDSGTPIQFDLHLPDGWTAGPTQWPAPTRHALPGDILDHVYEKSVTLIVPVRVPPTAKGEVRISADAKWLVCNEACISEKARLGITVPIAESAKPGADAPLFAAARQRIPQPLPTTGASIPRVSVTTTAIQVEAPGATGLAFFPSLECPEFRDLAGTGSSNGPAPRLVLKFADAQATVPVTNGVLEVRYADKTVWYQINPPTEATTAEQPRPALK